MRFLFMKAYFATMTLFNLMFLMYMFALVHISNQNDILISIRQICSLRLSVADS